MRRCNGNRSVTPGRFYRGLAAGWAGWLTLAAASKEDAEINRLAFRDGAISREKRTTERSTASLAATSLSSSLEKPSLSTAQANLGDIDISCRQHGSCNSCVVDKGWTFNCGWCPLDHQCHATHSLFSACSSNETVVERGSCPPKPSRRTNFSKHVAYQMTVYAEAAYYDDPTMSGHGIPESFQVLKVYKESIGTWQEVFGYVGLDKVSKKIVVAFRGTSSIAELVQELSHHSLVPIEGAPGAAKVGFYFYEATALLAPLVVSAVRDGRSLCGDCDVWITGHSLGAAIAAMFAVHIATEDPDKPSPLVYTFGQPRVGNSAWVQLYDTLLPDTYRLINAADIVAHIPFCTAANSSILHPSGNGTCSPDVNGYYHAGTEVWFPAGDYCNGVMCGFRECTREPQNEDITCSDGLVSDPLFGSYSIGDHSGYWTVLPGYPPVDYLEYCGNGKAKDSVGNVTIIV